MPHSVWYPNWQPVVYQRYTQDRLGKDKFEKGKESIDKSSIEEGDCKGRPDPERLKHFRFRVEFFGKQGWDVNSVYTLAAREGITKDMIDNAEVPS